MGPNPPIKHENTLDISAENLAIHWAINDHRGCEATDAQACGEDGRLPMAMRDGGSAAFPSRSSAVKAGHLGRGTSLIDEDELLRVEIELAIETASACGLHINAVLLRGMCR